MFEDHKLQRVTYNTKRAPLQKVLSQLSALTGLVLDVGIDNADWQVRDRNVIVSARDIPLANLMESIAGVLRLEWTRGSANGYRLIADQKIFSETEEPIRKIKEDSQNLRKNQVKKLLNGLSDPLIEHLDSPDLHKKVNLIFPSHEHDGELDVRLDDLLISLSESSGFSIIADGLCMAEGADDFSYAHEVKDVLDRLEQEWWYCNWEIRGSLLEITDRNWFRKLQNMVPEAMLERWRKVLRENGTLDIDHLAEIAALHSEQQSYVDDDEMLDGVFSIISDTCGFLECYPFLSDEEKAQVFSEQGLDISSLPPDHKMAERFESDLTLSLTKRRKNRHFVYKIKMISKNPRYDSELEFETPEYKEPEKEEPKS